MDLGVIGLGRIGSALAAAWLADGVPVHGFDVDAGARARATELGVRVHETLDSLLRRTTTVLTSLPTPGIVLEVVERVAAAPSRIGLLVETSTCGPSTATTATELLAGTEVSFVDAPVSGKPPAMTVYVGGPEGVLGELDRPLARVVGTRVHLGELGAGYTVKLLQQYVKYARFQVAGEALAYARSVGLDVATTAAALRAGTGAEPGLASADEHFLATRDEVARRAPLSTIVKDVGLVRALFDDAGLASPGLDALAALVLSPAAEEHLGDPYPDVLGLLPGSPDPERGPHP